MRGTVMPTQSRGHGTRTHHFGVDGLLRLSFGRHPAPAGLSIIMSRPAQCRPVTRVRLRVALMPASATLRRFALLLPLGLLAALGDGRAPGQPPAKGKAPPAKAAPGKEEEDPNAKAPRK